MQTYEIESGVEIPQMVTKSVIATLRKMKVGESFVMPSNRNNLSRVAKKAGVKITSKKIDNGRRVWRVE